MQSGLLFGSLVLENPPLQLANWREYLDSFLQDAGGFALLGLWFWIAVTLLRALSPSFRGGPGSRIPILILVVAVVSTALFVTGGISEMIAAAEAEENLKIQLNPLAPPVFSRWGNILMSAGGLLSLLGVSVPFVIDMARLRGRRIFALAKLSFIEAVRRRILFAFLVIVLLFLFPPKWWDPSIKPEDEIRSNISVIYLGTTPILLFAAALLTAFSIPNDIRNQTIHTIVTKPVEKFEIVIGRFLGLLGLTTLVLGGITMLSLAMLVLSRVEPEAREESMKARVPLYGMLDFVGPKDSNFSGENVGREWDYRRYIPGGGVNNPHRAIWHYSDRDLSRSLTDLPAVKCEFSFDIFRTTKGQENVGVFATFIVSAWQTNNRDLNAIGAEFRERIRGLSRGANPNGSEAERRDWDRLDKIAYDLGYFEFSGKEISDYHTDSILIPTGVFRKAFEADNPERLEIRGRAFEKMRAMVAVRCDSRTQFIGVARPDLYLLAGEGSFYWNFLKGSLGLWMRLIIVIGIAVTCSTYLNGVVSFLTTLFLVLLGFGRYFIISMAMIPFGGETMNNPGPADSLRKLISNESLGSAPDQSSATQQVTIFADSIFRWGLRRLLNVLPNMERFSWSDYVANGFNIPLDDLGISFLFVAGYLLLWVVMSHYLIKWREIATW